MVYWLAFWQLCSSRLYERGKIPWLAVEQWSSMAGMGASDTADMHFAIRRLDEAFLRFAVKAGKAPPQNMGKTSGQSGLRKRI